MKRFNKKEIRNVGFEKAECYCVDVKTNLASIDVDRLSELYKERYLAIDDRDRWFKKYNQIKEVNEQVVKANEEFSQENQKLKEENEKLKSDVQKMLYENVLRILKEYNDSPIQDTKCCWERWTKAMKSLKASVESGKPTYDQLLKENEKLKRENHSFRRGQESLEAEVDELDKECDALVEEKEALQAEVDSLRSSVEGYEKKNKELIRENDCLRCINSMSNDIDVLDLKRELAECKEALESNRSLVNYYKRNYEEVLKRNLKVK